MVERESRYTVDVRDRIAALMGDTEIEELTELTYTFTEGYEKLTYKRNPNYGSLEFAGSYHPNVVCEGKYICKWCGMTLFTD